MSDKHRILKTLGGVYSYYGKELSEFIIEIWLEDLAEYSADDIERAFVRHRKDPERGRFCPLSADILKQLNGDADEKALVAWGKVLEAAQSGGGRFTGATQEALDSMGGMGRIRMASSSENGFLQREFCSNFKAYKARSDREPQQITGEVKALPQGVGK